MLNGNYVLRHPSISYSSQMGKFSFGLSRMAGTTLSTASRIFPASALRAWKALGSGARRMRMTSALAGPDTKNDLSWNSHPTKEKSALMTMASSGWHRSTKTNS